MSQRFTTQAAEVVFEKEVEFPGKFCFVKGEPARDRLRLVSARGGFLNLRD